MAVEAKTKARKVCDDCRKTRAIERSRRAHAAKRPGPYTLTCEECGDAWEASRRTGRFCPPCRQERARLQRIAYSKRPEVAAKNRALAKERRYSRRHELAKKYGLDLDEYDAMVESRDGRCDICTEVPKDSLCVDHDHTTGAVRGLLCRRCNAALGSFKDSPATIDSAIQYLLQRGAA